MVKQVSQPHRALNKQCRPFTAYLNSYLITLLQRFPLLNTRNKIDTIYPNSNVRFIRIRLNKTMPYRQHHNIPRMEQVLYNSTCWLIAVVKTISQCHLPLATPHMEDILASSITLHKILMDQSLHYQPTIKAALYRYLKTIRILSSHNQCYTRKVYPESPS